MHVCEKFETWEGEINLKLQNNRSLILNLLSLQP